MNNPSKKNTNGRYTSNYHVCTYCKKKNMYLVSVMVEIGKFEAHGKCMSCKGLDYSKSTIDRFIAEEANK